MLLRFNKTESMKVKSDGTRELGFFPNAPVNVNLPDDKMAKLLGVEEGSLKNVRVEKFFELLEMAFPNFKSLLQNEIISLEITASMPLGWKGSSNTEIRMIPVTNIHCISISQANKTVVYTEDNPVHVFKHELEKMGEAVDTDIDSFIKFIRSGYEDEAVKRMVNGDTGFRSAKPAVFGGTKEVSPVTKFNAWARSMADASARNDDSSENTDAPKTSAFDEWAASLSNEVKVRKVAVDKTAKDTFAAFAAKYEQ